MAEVTPPHLWASVKSNSSGGSTMAEENSTFLVNNCRTKLEEQ
jgi:hypothetical protein